MKFTVRLAELNIEIEGQYDYLQEFCKDYCVEECEPDITIKIEMEDIEAERKDGGGFGFTKEYLETVATLRKISEILPLHNRFLFHGAAITYGTDGFLFTGPSGSGKTTHIRMWRRHLGEEVRVVNGDKPFLAIKENEVCVYGTPWAGKEKWQRNRSAQLKGICRIKQGAECSIRRLEPIECLDWMLKEIYIPQKSGMLDIALGHIEKILAHVPVYELTCDISEEAVKCSFEAMTGLKYEEKTIK